jgi:hypothetical protein
VRSPDGRDWEVTIQRVRLPSWRHSDYEPESDDLLSFAGGTPISMTTPPGFGDLES